MPRKQTDIYKIEDHNLKVLAGQARETKILASRLELVIRAMGATGEPTLDLSQHIRSSLRTIEATTNAMLTRAESLPK